jgi:tape measure domain-containing protein
MAELKLRVSLDTSYLKGQISRLPLEFAGANVSIRPKFDRQTIVNEFRLLNRYIGSKKFNIVINTNLNKEIENADRLVKALGRVQQAASGAKGGLPIGTQVLSRTKSKGGFAAAEIKTLFGAAVQGGLIDDKTLAATRAQMVAALGSIGRDSIAGLLNGLKSGDADIQAAAQTLGNNLIASFKTVLGIASPSKEFKKLGEAAGQGFEQGLLKSIEIAEQSATRKMQRMLDRLARMALIMGGISGPEIGRQIAQARALPSLNFGATTPRASVGIGPSSTGRALPPGASRPELPGTAFARQKYLPTALGEELKEVLRGAANAFLDSIRQNIRAVNVTDMGTAPSRQGMLQGGSVAGFLPGRASASSVLELNNILAGAIREYFKSVAREIKYKSSAIGRASIPTTPLLAQSRVAGLLPQSVGRTPSVYRSGPRESQEQLFARRTREAYINSAARAADIRQSPLALPPGVGLGQPPMMRAPNVPPSMGGGGVPPTPPRGGGGGGSFGGMQFNVPKLPGAGLVREIGTEFGFAAKQVLLFGTAYKALAFIQGFPAQVGAAVGALQSFRNTIQAISPSAEEAAASSQFILDVVDKYNTPIQSARDGFTKLYASMKPTGFSGNEIRDLFLGISQAAATFGMSAEKVDRVNYAFAQMASKGQVMSEELKGQLGDVLPGAMGIFAEAAGFTGPDAITKFSKALEDGVYKGAAMKTLLTSVGVIMRKEFGPGAEGAARTFQGVINRMQNSFKLLYESFEPVAVGFLNSVVMPMTSGIKTLADGFNAFFTGTLAKTEGGAAFAQVLDSLKPSFEGIRANLTALIPSFQTFGKLLLSVTQFLVTLAGNPITGFLLKVYANVLLVNTAFTLLGGRILLGLITNINAAIIRFVAFGYAINAVGIQTTGANTALAGTQLQMMLLQRNAGAALAPVNALLGSLARIAAIGTIAVVLTIAISNMNELRDAEARLNRLRGARAESVVGPTGPRPIQTAQARFAGASRETIEEARGKQTKYLTDLTLKRQALERKLQTAQGENLAAMADANSASITTAGNRLAVAQANLASINQDIKNAQEVLRLDPRNYRRQAEINKVSTPGMSVTSGGGGGAAGAKPKEKKERESQIPQLMLQLEKTKELSAVEMQIVNAQLISNTSQLSSLELLKRLIEFKYEAKSLALEDLTTEERALKYKEIGLRREQAIFENQLQLQIDLKKERDEIQQGFAATLAGYQEEANFQQMYLDLINQGVLPSLAKVRVEAAKAFAEGEKKLDQSIEQIQLNIAGLELSIEALKLEKNLTPEKQKQLEADEKRLDILKEDLRLRGLLKDTAPERKGAAIAAAEGTLAPKTASEYAGEGLEAAQDRLKELTNTGYQVVQAANAIGDAFGEAFKGVITGSMTAREALAGFFQGVADHFADMVAQMIAEYLKMALIKGIMGIIGGAAGALGGGLSSGFNAGTSSAIDTGAAGWASSFATPLKFANGGIAPGGFTAFANGGIVTGPTLGLVGEGRYNEAVIPLPDGKSVPVDLGGAMGSQAVNNIVVNVDAQGSKVEGDAQESKQLGRVIAAAIQQELVKQKRPGGLLS